MKISLGVRSVQYSKSSSPSAFNEYMEGGGNVLFPPRKDGVEICANDFLMHNVNSFPISVYILKFVYKIRFIYSTYIEIVPFSIYLLPPYHAPQELASSIGNNNRIIDGGNAGEGSLDGDNVQAEAAAGAQLGETSSDSDGEDDAD